MQEGLDGIVRYMELGTLDLVPVVEHLDKVAAPVAAALQQLPEASQVFVAQIDPALSDTAAFCAEYQVAPAQAANCVIIEAKRGEVRQFVACVVLATTRADVNGVVRKIVDARKASFASMEEAVAQSGMEFGAITPIGLPVEWPVLVDAAVVESDVVVIGSGVRNSKLALPGNVLAALPNAQVVADLARLPQ